MHGCAPYMGALKILGTPCLHPRLFFPKFSWALFRLTLWICVQNLKSVALRIPELIGGSHKIQGGLSLAMPTLSIPPKYYMCWSVPIGPVYILFVYQHMSARNFRSQFWVGVANPKSWGKGGLRGSGMVLFERALVSSYKPSIVTFSLSLRISEILSLLFSKTPLFPYPTSSLPKISPCSPRNRWITFWLQRAKMFG